MIDGVALSIPPYISGSLFNAFKVLVNDDDDVAADDDVADDVGWRLRWLAPFLLSFIVVALMVV